MAWAAGGACAPPESRRCVYVWRGEGERVGKWGRTEKQRKGGTRASGRGAYMRMNGEQGGRQKRGFVAGHSGQGTSACLEARWVLRGELGMGAWGASSGGGRFPPCPVPCPLAVCSAPFASSGVPDEVLDQFFLDEEQVGKRGEGRGCRGQGAGGVEGQGGVDVRMNAGWGMGGKGASGEGTGGGGTG